MSSVGAQVRRVNFLSTETGNNFYVLLITTTMNRGFRFFNRFGRDLKTITSTGLATSTFLATLNYHNSFAEGSNGANNIGESYLVYQPSFGLASTNSSRMNKNEDDEPLDMTLIGIIMKYI